MDVKHEIQSKSRVFQFVAKEKFIFVLKSNFEKDFSVMFLIDRFV